MCKIHVACTLRAKLHSFPILKQNDISYSWEAFSDSKATLQREKIFNAVPFAKLTLRTRYGQFNAFFCSKANS